MDKASQKFELLFNLLHSVKETYDNANDYQKEYLSTIIGAAIYYIPVNKETFSGMISEKAARVPKKQRVKEHEYPRKIAGKLLLDNPPISVDKLKKLYTKKYGVWNWVTKKENTLLRKYQKGSVFINPKKAYKLAEINLIRFED